MSLFKVALPELDGLPLERRKAIIEGFNTASETAVLRERAGKLPCLVGAVLTMVVMGVMVWVYDMGFWPCMLPGLLCFALGIPLGIWVGMVLLRRALKRYVQRRAVEGLSG